MKEARSAWDTRWCERESVGGTRNRQEREREGVEKAPALSVFTDQ